jgi:hypothetical protein
MTRRNTGTSPDSEAPEQDPQEVAREEIQDPNHPMDPEHILARRAAYYGKDPEWLRSGVDAFARAIGSTLERELVLLDTDSGLTLAYILTKAREYRRSQQEELDLALERCHTQARDLMQTVQYIRAIAPTFVYPWVADALGGIALLAEAGWDLEDGQPFRKRPRWAQILLQESVPAPDPARTGQAASSKEHTT